MYGLVVKLTSVSGRRAELIEVLGGTDASLIFLASSPPLLELYFCCQGMAAQTYIGH